MPKKGWSEGDRKADLWQCEKYKNVYHFHPSVLLDIYEFHVIFEQYIRIRNKVHFPAIMC